MLDPDNAAALSRTGRVFCLIATPEEILARVSNDPHAKRPLLSVENPMERIVELMQQRHDGYGRFPQMETSAKTPDVVTQNLVGIFQSNPDLRVPVTGPGTRYEYIVGGGLLSFVKNLAGIVGPVAIITDTNTGPLYAPSCGPVDVVVEVPPGQQHKTLAVVQSICAQLIEKGFDRSGTIIGLGGSVISGLAGFVAAVYMRGVDIVHCPTSLLAMADTSIGGKAGINLPQGKNLVGAFKQPKAVIADVATLQSLSPEEFSSGMAEVIKHSLIDDAELFARIESGSWERKAGTLIPPLPDLQALVARAIQVKIRIVQEDPFDQGRRSVLNLGHTFAHAIEQVCEHTIRHGDAVAMGLVAAVNLSACLGHCPAALQDQLEAVLADVGLPTRIPTHIDLSRVYDAMRRDKKAASGRMRLVMLRAIGDVFLTDQVTRAEVLSTLEAIKG
jgi:3-dehydroquinate synthase